MIRGDDRASYGRPFKRAALQLRGDEWHHFEEPERQRLHDRLLELRDKLFAHNDVTPYRRVVVIPPGAFTPQGSASEEQSAFQHAEAAHVRQLCRIQLERMKHRRRRPVTEPTAADADEAESEKLRKHGLL